MAIYRLLVSMADHMRLRLLTIFLPMGFALKVGGEIVNTLRPATLLDGISHEIWRESLKHLAEQFYTLLTHCHALSDNFSPLP